MQVRILEQLLNINREFYQTFASSFAKTRQRVQPGILIVLDELPKQGNWLDLGCGNGALALEWDRQRRKGLYYGLDFSAGLLDCARSTLTAMRMSPDLRINFCQADLMEEDWVARLPAEHWDGVLAFAVLHHIPSQTLRRQLLKQINGLLDKGEKLVLSVWQFQHSPKLMERRISWEQAGISDADVEGGDTLMDWRADIKDAQSAIGLRYVHLFSREELADLARLCGFLMIDEFESDGYNGKLGLYQIWQKL